MSSSFSQWQKDHARLVIELKQLLEEEFEALLLSTPNPFKALQKKKTPLLQAYTTCILEGKTHEASLKELSPQKKEGVARDMEELQGLANRNVRVAKKRLKELQQSFAAFQQWTKRPALQGPYHINVNFSLGLDRRI